VLCAEQLYNSLFIRGRNLRMVHLPQGLDAASTLEQHIQQLKKQRVAAALAAVNKRHVPVAKGVGDASADAGAGAGAGAGDSSAAAAAAAGGGDWE
jgi:hypothetical protein